MNIQDALLHMIDSSGKSRSLVSIELGKTRNYIASSVKQSANRGTLWNPYSDTFTSIAKLCGYKVVLKGHGEEIELD